MLLGGCASTQGPARSQTSTSAAPPAAAAVTAPAASAPGTPPAPGSPLLPDGPPVERIAVPLGGPQRGPSTAKVTIVEFSDFQCPFCGRVIATLEQLRADYPNDVRILFRHNPLPFHNNAAPAAEAAVAAETQGKFWEMHDKLFNDQKDLDRPALEQRAVELGLDLKAFRAALDGHAGKARVDEDLALGRQLGVRGTPNFFINGRPVMGAQPVAVFKQIIDDEIVRANSLLRRGLPADKLYATLLTGAKFTMLEPEAYVSTEVYNVPIGDAPSRGAKQPKVTMIEFGDFQGPFCGRVEATLDALLKSYGGSDLAIVFRHAPLPFHPDAMTAALAAEAAREQGKFWEMHDKLFANRASLDRPSLDGYAASLGLDAARFRASVDGEVGKPRIRHDLDDAQRFAATASPTFFINGRLMSGNQPLEAFKQVIAEEIRKADALLAAGTPRAELYAAFTKAGLDKKSEPPPPKPPHDPDEETRFRIDIAAAPVRGAKDAPITIVEWADFQCPFCGRAEETLQRLASDYPDKLRFVWRDLPLPFHQHAMPAAIAARAAGEQGKFWAMHDWLMAEQGGLDRAALEKDAAELGLEMKRFRAALDADKGKAAIDDDAKAGAKVGAVGTPSFFVNGKPIRGAQPYEVFKSRIDAELKITDAMLAKGTPRARIYAALMKDAQAIKIPTAKGDGGEGEAPGPEADAQVYPVKPGDAPAKGPTDAPLVMVVFSDFQCPFCKRVEPTLADLQKHYGKKLRVVWKNYPLPFHNNAGIAAEAAMAADAQGKFWQMHDKLFDNNTALDRDSLEQYAVALNLDLARFKADPDSGRFKTRVQADTKEGSDVGVTGTPAVFINGRKIAGAYPLETFQKVADQELAKVGGGGTGKSKGKGKGTAKPVAPKAGKADGP